MVDLECGAFQGSQAKYSSDGQHHASLKGSLRIPGHLDPARTVWFDDLTLTQNDDGTTELVGPLSDRLLTRLRDLGATLLLVEQLPAGGAEPVGYVEDLEQSDFMTPMSAWNWGDVKT